MNDAGGQMSTQVHLHAGISCVKICPLKWRPNIIKLKAGWLSVSKGMRRGGEMGIKVGGQHREAKSSSEVRFNKAATKQQS